MSTHPAILIQASPDGFLQADGTRTTSYQFQAMGLETPAGIQLVPNPHGRQAASYPTLEQAMAAVHQAGFDAIWQGQVYPYRGTNIPSTSPSIPPATPLNALDQAANALIPLLLARLTDREVPVVTACLETLGALQATDTLAHVEALLLHESPEIRQSLALCLAQLGRPALGWVSNRYQQALQQASKSDSYRIRLALMAIYTEMARQWPPAWLLPVMNQLQQGLADDHWLVRAQAAQTLLHWSEKRQTEQQTHQSA